MFVSQFPHIHTYRAMYVSQDPDTHTHLEFPGYVCFPVPVWDTYVSSTCLGYIHTSHEGGPMEKYPETYILLYVSQFPHMHTYVCFPVSRHTHIPIVFSICMFPSIPRQTDIPIISGMFVSYVPEPLCMCLYVYAYLLNAGFVCIPLGLQVAMHAYIYIYCIYCIYIYIDLSIYLSIYAL